MKKILCAFLVFILIGCDHKHSSEKKDSTIKAAAKKTVTTAPAVKPMVHYSDQQLEAFLDSVGHLPTQPLADNIAFGADSLFKSPPQHDTLISAPDVKILKNAVNRGVISAKIARRIFNNNQISDSCNSEGIFTTYKIGFIPVVYYPFNLKNGEYGICVGNPDNCKNPYLYFFKGDRIVAKHDIYQRNSEKLRWFKDSEGKTVVYYSKEFDEGSGIWWFNYFFYKYDGNKIIPVLNIPQNINLLQPSPWGLRELWLECIIKKTNPLTIKMVYHQQLPDTANFDHFTTGAISSPMIVNDSTCVKYLWNEQTKMFDGQYNMSKITKSQILSYYLADNELLFINTYYNRLKTLFNNKKKKIWVVNYLNRIKNHEAGNKTEEE